MENKLQESTNISSQTRTRNPEYYKNNGNNVNSVNLTGNNKRGFDFKYEEMKRNRKTNTIVMAFSGGVLGMIALGPVGAVAGSIVGAKATKHIGRHNERKYQAERDENVQFK